MGKLENRVRKTSSVMIVLMKIFMVVMLVSVGFAVAGLVGIGISPDNFISQLENLNVSLNWMLPTLFMDSVNKTVQILIYYLVGNIFSVLIMFQLHKFFKQIKLSENIKQSINIKVMKVVAIMMIIKGIVLSSLNILDDSFSNAFDIIDFNFMESIIGAVILFLSVLLEYILADKDSLKD